MRFSPVPQGLCLSVESLSPRCSGCRAFQYALQLKANWEPLFLDRANPWKHCIVVNGRIPTLLKARLRRSADATMCMKNRVARLGRAIGLIPVVLNFRAGISLSLAWCPQRCALPGFLETPHSYDINRLTRAEVPTGSGVSVATRPIRSYDATGYWIDS
jgi:hypothetical protein